MTRFPRWGFWRKPPVPWNDPNVLREMFMEVMDLVVNELDPEPRPWDAYLTTPEYAQAAAILQRFHYGLYGHTERTLQRYHAWSPR